MLLSAPVSTSAASMLPRPLHPASQLCTIVTQTFNHLGNTAYENTAETLMEKSLLSATATGAVFRLMVRSFRQTNARGLNQLDEDMVRLKEEVIAETDESGRLVRILNKEQLKNKFQKLRPHMLRTYKNAPFITPNVINNIGAVLEGEGYLEDVLNSSPEYGTLFPGLYGRVYSTTDAQPVGRRLIPRILATIDLPLRMSAVRADEVPADVAYGVRLTGELDQTAFRAADLQQAVRTITDSFDLDASLKVRHLESYEFDAREEMLYGAQLSNFGVKGVFSTQVVCTLKTAALT